MLLVGQITLDSDQTLFALWLDKLLPALTGLKQFSYSNFILLPCVKMINTVWVIVPVIHCSHIPAQHWFWVGISPTTTIISMKINVMFIKALSGLSKKWHCFYRVVLADPITSPHPTPQHLFSLSFPAEVEISFSTEQSVYELLVLRPIYIGYIFINSGRNPQI